MYLIIRSINARWLSKKKSGYERLISLPTSIVPSESFARPGLTKPLTVTLYSSLIFSMPLCLYCLYSTLNKVSSGFRSFILGCRELRKVLWLRSIMSSPYLRTSKRLIDLIRSLISSYFLSMTGTSFCSFFKPLRLYSSASF